MTSMSIAERLFEILKIVVEDLHISCGQYGNKEGNFNINGAIKQLQSVQQPSAQMLTYVCLVSVAIYASMLINQ